VVDRLDQLRPQLKLVRRVIGAVGGFAVAFTVACSNGQAETTQGGGRVLSASPGRVDSILPTGEALRRFVAGLPVVTALQDGAPSRDSLVKAFIAAVRDRDQDALARLSVTQAEYGHLYYPSSVYARKPYELTPDIAWMLNRQNSQKAIGRVLQRLGGERVELIGYSCCEPLTESVNRVWRDCRVSYRDRRDAKPATRQLFGSILERAGTFKFLSYASDF